MTDEHSEIPKTDSLGRVRTSRQRREAILDDFEQSAISGVAYARRHGINYQTFANWIQKRRRARGDYDKGKPAEEESATGGGMELTLAEVRVEAPAPPEPAIGLRVELPGGASLVIEEATQTELAARLIRQLSSR